MFPRSLAVCCCCEFVCYIIFQNDESGTFFDVNDLFPVFNMVLLVCWLIFKSGRMSSGYRTILEGLYYMIQCDVVQLFLQLALLELKCRNGISSDFGAYIDSFAVFRLGIFRWILSITCSRISSHDIFGFIFGRSFRDSNKRYLVCSLLNSFCHWEVFGAVCGAFPSFVFWSFNLSFLWFCHVEFTSHTSDFWISYAW